MDIHHETVTTNGITLQVAQAGADDAPLVILLHGFPDFWYGWRKQIEPLAQAGFRVWVPDQRGYNKSDKPGGVAAYNLDELAKDVIGLIDAAGRDKVYLVGHDWGGAVAWWVANKYPGRLHKLVIFNVPHHRVFAKFFRANRSQRRRSAYIITFQIPLLPQFMLKVGNFALLKRALRRSSLPDTFTPEDFKMYCEAWRQPNAIKSMLNWYRAMIQKLPERPDTWRITIPTLLIWGKQDRFLGWDMAQPSINMCDNGRLEIIENATHWVAQEVPEQVNQLMIEFFQ